LSDGAAMYVLGIPVLVFQLVLVINVILKIGIVYNPFINRLYTDIKGKGGYKNN